VAKVVDIPVVSQGIPIGVVGPADWHDLKMPPYCGCPAAGAAEVGATEVGAGAEVVAGAGAGAVVFAGEGAGAADVAAGTGAEVVADGDVLLQPLRSKTITKVQDNTARISLFI
jgi:hypothetical protein